MPAPLQGVSTAPQEACQLPLCKDADALRQSGDLQGALKLYRYIQEEVDVDEKVVRKPLLWLTIASLHLALDQTPQGLEALEKYRQYIATRPDTDLPAGYRRDDAERLGRELRAHVGRLRIASNVPGAKVLLDGKEVGVTPLSGPLLVPPGKHRIELAGATTESQEVEVPPGQEVLIWSLQSQRPAAPAGALGAAPSSGAEGARSSRPAWRIGLGVVGIAAGVTMISLGAASLAADGKCPSGGCSIGTNGDGLPVMRVVDGRAVGGGLLAAGIVAAAAGSVLIALPGKRAPLRASLFFDHGASLSVASAF